MMVIILKDKNLDDYKTMCNNQYTSTLFSMHKMYLKKYENAFHFYEDDYLDPLKINSLHFKVSILNFKMKLLFSNFLFHFFFFYFFYSFYFPFSIIP